jgi:hypothetical protein
MPALQLLEQRNAILRSANEEAHRAIRACHRHLFASIRKGWGKRSEHEHAVFHRTETTLLNLEK